VTSELTLALGPTNTGKTHRAIERMLAHDSGMIGLPLRLLAREVYDRVSARVGERAVALVTGEEKRIPPAPRYWIATVEAMPQDVGVDFLAVDEIQLAAHRERGHVFTDRLLRARGRLETWFLGADTMAPLLRELLPDAALRRQHRMSTLKHRGRSGLGGLPARSAVVAFSATEVYALAARLRARKGGAAVVLGGLSPRTRNAQVALYQAREVSYLVATDAIGMGLNLDVDHVAFASVTKYDGRAHRQLVPAELAQIAGRAGRHTRDGTFGTLNPLPGLKEHVARAIETHRFGEVRRLVWRSADLDFSSIDALIGSLAAPAPSARYTRVEQADDFDTLRALAARPPIRERATDPARVRLLWEVCQVPDFRKLLLLRHVALLAEVYVQLVDHGRLEGEWVERSLRRIDRLDGEVDTLTARLAAIRVWTYLSHRDRWLDDAGAWRERTRAIEDRLGDALHERLVERFVEHGRRVVVAPGHPPPAVDDDSPFAGLRELWVSQRDDAERSRGAWVEDVVAAPHDAFDVDDDGRVAMGERELGRLVGGRGLTSPELRLEIAESLGAGARSRLERRLAAFAKDFVAELLAPLRALDGGSGAARGLRYQLEQRLGAASRRDARDQIDALDADERARLEEAGVVFGRRTVFARALLELEAMRRRELLARLRWGAVRSAEAHLATGHVLVAKRPVRVDALEEALDALRTSKPPFEVPDVVRDALGEDPKLLSALGYRVLDDGRLVPKKKRRRRRR